MSSERQVASRAAPARIESPCQRRCCLDNCDTCLGCGRTLDEILAWNESDAQQRLAICQRASQRLLRVHD